jgi:HSP20 family molecular chaperone IbpA
MSFFPRTFVSNDPTSFHPLFRLLEDFDSYSRGTTTNNNHNHHHRSGNVMKSFTPKFDVREIGEAYELHGELPGVDQSNVEIEFTDAQTLVVRGRTERSYTSGTPPAGFIEPSKAAGAITDSKANKEPSGHQATVEDEDADAVNVSAPKDATEVVEQDAKPDEPQEKYWVSERSVGQFSRSFTFPVRVNSEQVQASMKNGILSIVVPKAAKDQARKITIS